MLSPRGRLFPTPRGGWPARTDSGRSCSDVAEVSVAMVHVMTAASGGRAARSRPHQESGHDVRRRREIRLAYVLLAPAALLVFGVIAYPLSWQIWTSLTDRATDQTAAHFVGLANYAALIQDPSFWRAALYTVAYIVITTACKLAVGTAMGMGLAHPFPGRAVAFIAAFLPWAYPAGPSEVGWFWFLIPPIPAWYGDFMAHWRTIFDNALGTGTWGFFAVVLLNIWRGGSFVGIFLLAARNGIPDQLFEYAALEARTAWQMFWLVTVPVLRPFMALAAFLTLTMGVADLSNIWMQSGLRDVYPVVWTQAIQLVLNGGIWGPAAAETLILVPLLLAVLLLCFRLFEPLEEDPA
jgi:ABC-type sugar transport system permease subunit